MIQARLKGRTRLYPTVLLTVMLVALASDGATTTHAKALVHVGRTDAHSVIRTGAPSALTSVAPTSVNEYGNLRMQYSKGTTIAEKGICWGTFNCSVAMRMTLSGTLVTAGFTAYLKGGTIGGVARAHIRTATTKDAYFSGTLTLQGSTGSHSHASGVAVFQGTIDRTSYALSIRVIGKLRL